MFIIRVLVAGLLLLVVTPLYALQFTTAYTVLVRPKSDFRAG